MITITITNTLDDTWAESGQLEALSDTEILSLVKEDIVEFVNGACWSVDHSFPQCGAIFAESISANFQHCGYQRGHEGPHSWGTA